MDLALEEYLINLVLEETEIDDLDGNWLAGLIRATFVDMAGVAFPDDIVESIGISLYFFACEGGSHVLCFSNLKNNNI